MDQENNLALLIDFENIAAGTEKEGLGRFDVRKVIRRLKDKGRILVARAYGDWGRFARFKQTLLEAGITMIELTSYRGQDKNRADIALVVDAMEFAFTRTHIDTYVIMSGDSDFTPVVERLKELNKKVIGIGTRGSTSRLIIERCDEFIFYESIRSHTDVEERVREAPGAETLSRDEAFALMVETLEGLQKEQPDPVQAGIVKQSMKRKAPTFDETEYDFISFARFLEAAREKGLVALHRDERAGGYRVDLPGAQEPARPPKVQQQRPPEPEEEHTPVLMDGAAGRLQQALLEAGIDPLTQLQRHTVVHEFVDHVVERQAKKKRNTLMYVYGDIARRCRRTDPMVPQAEVRQVLDSLRISGQLYHSDGKPIRSNTAHFTISLDAEELLRELRTFYVTVLLERGVALTDSRALSLLLWGDENHGQASEELVAWVQHELATRKETPVEAPTEATRDDEREARESVQDEDGEDGGPRRRRRRRRGSRSGDGGHEGGNGEEAEGGAQAALAFEAPADQAPAAPSEVEAAAPVEELPAEEEAPAPVEEAPAPVEEAPAAEVVAAEEAAPTEAPPEEEDPAPKKRPTRRRTTRKKAAPAGEPPASD